MRTYPHRKFILEQVLSDIVPGVTFSFDHVRGRGRGYPIGIFVKRLDGTVALNEFVLGKYYPDNTPVVL